MARSILSLAGGCALALAALHAPVGAGPLDNPGFAKSLTCSACHGADGNSRSNFMPIIAGMDVAYFKKQIDAYATGKRPSPEMEPFAKMVQVLGADQVAAYFREQKMRPTPIAVDAAAVARGRAASAPCATCHGPDGKGNAVAHGPALAGQPPGYLREQMLLFKQDRRSPGDLELKSVKQLMATVPDAAFADLAAYYSSLR
jgi:cytochrome c553